jgi:hypothetical protein
MNENYTVLAFIRDEPLRIVSIIRNFHERAKILVLLDSEDTTTKAILIENSIEYRIRPDNLIRGEREETEWILKQSSTDYVFFCIASFYISLKLLNIFDQVSKYSTHDAIKHANVYWSFGALIQQQTILRRSSSCHFFNRQKVDLDRVGIHNEFAINKDAKFLVLPPNLNHALNVFRDDDMVVVAQKHIDYAEREALQRLEKSKKVTFFTIASKTIYAFINNYIRMGGFRAGTPGLIFHTHYAIYIFLVYSRIWEYQNNKTFTQNRINHQEMRLKMIDQHILLESIKDK